MSEFAERWRGSVMAGEWTEKTFAELIGGPQNIIGGPFGSNLTQADYTSDGVPVIRGSNMGQMGRFIAGEFAYVSDQKANTLASNQALPGDIIVTQRGTMGQISLVPLGGPDRFIVSQSQMAVRGTACDPMFIYYLLTSRLFLDYLEGATIQTGVPHINMGILRSWRVLAPERRTQELLAAILSPLDEKIELNRRMAGTLEETARTLFKSWFVDFDPVRAKAEGRPTGMPAGTMDLFPDRFGEDGLPQGWTKRTLPSLATFLNGLALQKYPALDGDIGLPILKIPELRTGPTVKSGRAASALPEQYIVREGDQVFAWSGSLLQTVWTHAPAALNQHLFKVVPREVPQWLCYFAVDLHLSEFQAIASDKAVTMGHIQRHHLDDAAVSIPAAAVINEFSATFEPIWQKIIASRVEAQTLVALRDTILPKLISGELDIEDASASGVAA